MAAQLLVISGPDLGRAFPLKPGTPLLIGRGRQTATRLNDLHVSRSHTQVEVRGAQVVLKDLSSASGTYVNGERVTEHALQLGDVIRIGNTALRLQSEDIAEQLTLQPDLQPAPVLFPAQMKPPPKEPLPKEPPLGVVVTQVRQPAKAVRLPAERLGELTGTVLAHFQIGPLLGKGKTGIVFRARDLKGSRQVALKVLFPGFSENETEMQRFIRSMKTMLPLRRPNLVTLFGAGKRGPYCWIAMEYVEGETLAQAIRRIGVAGRLDWRYAFRVAVHIGRALEYAQENQVIHRNLTPQNVLVRGSDKVAKLGDLMMAKALEGTLAERLTRSGELLGDIHYMSPERTQGIDHVDGRSDIYSLGALVYALLTGRPPFAGQTFAEMILKIRQAEPEPPKKYQMAVPDALQGIVLQMLAKRPEDRYQTAAQFLKDLERAGKYLRITV